MEKKKIAYIITGLGIGGAEKLLLDLCSNEILDNYNITIYFLKGNGELQEEFTKKNVKVIKVFKKNHISLMHIIKFYKSIRDNDYDLIHAHLIHSAIFAFIFSRFLNKPVIITEHNISNWTTKNRFLLFLYKYCLNYCNKVIAISEAVRNELISRGIGKDNIITIYNGIEIEKFNSDINKFNEIDCIRRKGTKRIFGIVARLDKRKGIDILIKAFIDLFKNSHENVLVIIGEGEEYSKLKRLSKHYNNIYFLGKKTDPIEYYKKMDVFVLPSLSEGLGISIIEAMICKKPIIASNVGGIQEIVKYDGLLVEPGSVDSLKHAIKKYLDNERKYINIGDSAQERICNTFSMATCINRHFDLYNTVLSN